MSRVSHDWKTSLTLKLLNRWRCSQCAWCNNCGPRFMLSCNYQSADYWYFANTVDHFHANATIGSLAVATFWGQRRCKTRARAFWFPLHQLCPIKWAFHADCTTSRFPPGNDFLALRSLWKTVAFLSLFFAKHQNLGVRVHHRPLFTARPPGVLTESVFHSVDFKVSLL